MKKRYITPQTYCVKAETTAIMAGSGDKYSFSLGEQYHEEGEITEDDDDVVMYSKGYDAWSTWDE